MAKKTSFKIPVWAWGIGIILLLGLWLVGQYNSLVGLDVEVQNKWAEVETQYQRRADLVPQLVSTVQGAAEFEQSTFVDVTEARTQWLNSQSDPNATIEDQMAASNSFDSAFSRLLVTVEAYPELNATEGFMTLQSQLEGNENRISVARKDYNDEVTVFNGTVRKVPKNLIASIFGFDQYPLFESSEGAEVAPTIEFDF